MKLKILLPYKVFAQKDDVTNIVAQSPSGSFGILPHRLDCTVALSQGILTYESETEGEVFIAIDEGVLVKAGMDVFISVRNAVKGTELNELHEAVKKEFKTMHETEKNNKLILAKLESSLIHKLLELRNE